MAREWLVCTLLSAYRSAEDHYERYRNIATNGFRPSERLLNLAGRNSRKDLLLAQGHDELHSLPLLVFCLIQCDAFRSKDGSFNPSIDARCAAAAAISSMSPSALTRCIAPRLEFWVSGDNTGPLHEHCKMNMIELRNLMQESFGFHKNTNKSELELQEMDKPLLFLDSPRQVLVCDCHDFCGLPPINNENDVPKKLIQSVELAKQSYRVAPPVKIAWNDSSAEFLKHLSDALIEDSVVLVSETFHTYDEWTTIVAEILYHNIEEENA